MVQLALTLGRILLAYMPPDTAWLILGWLYKKNVESMRLYKHANSRRPEQATPSCPTCPRLYSFLQCNRFFVVQTWLISHLHTTRLWPASDWSYNNLQYWKMSIIITIALLCWNIEIGWGGELICYCGLWRILLKYWLSKYLLVLYTRTFYW